MRRVYWASVLLLGGCVDPFPLATGDTDPIHLQCRREAIASPQARALDRTVNTNNADSVDRTAERKRVAMREAFNACVRRLGGS